MIIHYNCTRLFHVTLVVADLPPSFHEMIFTLVPLDRNWSRLKKKKKKKNLESVSCI